MLKKSIYFSWFAYILFLLKLRWLSKTDLIRSISLLISKYKVSCMVVLVHLFFEYLPMKDKKSKTNLNALSKILS